MTKKKIKEIAVNMRLAKSGVDYSPRSGATCPHCKTPRALVIGSLPWENNCKVRYHKCRNPECPIAISETNIKSIQFDQ